MKIVNGSNKVLMLPLGGTMMTIMPKSVSGDIVASKALVTAAITTASVKELGLVTYSAAELQLINEVSGAAPFIYQDLEDATTKLLPEGEAPIVEQRVVQGGETVAIATERVGGVPSSANLEEIQSLTAQLGEQTAKVETLEKESKQKSDTIQKLENEIKELKLTAGKAQKDPELEKKLIDLETTKGKLEKLLSEEQDKNASITKDLEEAKTLLSQKNQKIEELQNAETASGIDPEELKKAQDEAKRFKDLLAKTVERNGLAWNAEEKAYLPVNA